MDDLDGILAAKLNIRSELGAALDNVCDAVAHIVFVMAVGMRLGGVCAATGLVAVVAIVLRVASRLDPDSPKGTGSPTNELMRHMLFILLLAQIFGFSPMLFLITAFILHAISMLMPIQMPYLIRSLTKSATAIGLVNLALVTAWLLPRVAPVIAACFIVTYLYSFMIGGVGWLKGAGYETRG